LAVIDGDHQKESKLQRTKRSGAAMLSRFGYKQ